MKKFFKIFLKFFFKNWFSFLKFFFKNLSEKTALNAKKFHYYMSGTSASHDKLLCIFRTLVAYREKFLWLRVLTIDLNSTEGRIEFYNMLLMLLSLQSPLYGEGGALQTQ